jgi:hypothetical protein
MKDEIQSPGSGGGRQTSLSANTKPKTNFDPRKEGRKKERKKEKRRKEEGEKHGYSNILYLSIA